MKKRILAVLMAAAVMSSAASAVSYPAKEFKDVSNSSWYADAVQYVYQNGIFAGMSETEFAPEIPMTRGMFVQVLANQTEGYDAAAYTKSPFEDVKEGDWFAPAVQWALENGVAAGRNSDYFYPLDEITREEAVTLLFKYAKLIGVEVYGSDSPMWVMGDGIEAAEWAYEPFNWALSNNIIAGIENGYIHPKELAARAQMAAVFSNVRDYFPAEKTITRKVMTYRGTDADGDAELSLEIQMNGRYPSFKLRRQDDSSGDSLNYTEWSGECRYGELYDAMEKTVVSGGDAKTIYTGGYGSLKFAEDGTAAYWFCENEDIRFEFEVSFEVE